MIAGDAININITICHLVNARFGDFYAGFFHVSSAIENLLPLIALAIFIGQQKKEIARKSLIAFLLTILVGAIAGLFFQENSFFLFLCIFSFVLAGGIVAIQLKSSLITGIILAGFIGLSQGLANGAAMQQGMQVIQFTAGIIATGLLIVSLIAGLVLSFEKPWQKIAIRVIGSWIAAIGIMYTPFLIMNNTNL